MIAQCHWSRAKDTEAQKELQKPERSGGMEEASQFLYYSEVCSGLSIYLSSMVIILFKFTWRRSFLNGYVLLKCSSCRKCVSSWVIAGQRFYAGYCAGWLSGGLFFSLYSLVAQHSISGYVVGMATRVCSMKRKRTLNSLTPPLSFMLYLCLPLSLFLTSSLPLSPPHL